MAWNETARIACNFSFRCPRAWDHLSLTDNADIRHCLECDRDVYLALTEQDFRQYANEGRCVAVKVLQPELSAEDGKKEFFTLGQVRIPYNPHLRRV